MSIAQNPAAATGLKPVLPPKPPGAQAARRRSLQVAAWQCLIFALFIGGWELGGRLHWFDPNFFSQPSHIGEALWSGIGDGSLVELLLVTLYEVLAGYLIAAVTGFLLGAAMAEFEMVDRVLQPFLIGCNNVPRIALAPLFVIWFGLGSESRIILTFSLVFFVVVYNTRAGFQALRRDHILLARSLGFGTWARYRKFLLPTAMPSIFAGLQLGLALAFTGAIVGEMLTGNAGLGGYMAYQVNTFGTDQFFAALTLLVVVSLVISGAMRVIESAALKWRKLEMR